MSDRLARDAGKALSWKTIQHAGVKLIYLVRLLVLARLLTPDDFGLVAIAATGVGFFVSITNFGIIPALIQGENLEENHYHVGWSIRVTRALAITLFVIAAAPVIADIFAEPRAVMFLRVLALRPLFEALSSIKVVNLNKGLNFRPLAVIGLAEALSNTLISIIWAKPLGVWALVIGTLGGAAAYLVMSYLLAPYRPRLMLDSPAAKRLVKFGRWIFLTSLIGIAGNQILRVMISRNLGAAELGLYYLAAQLAFLLSEVASQVIGEVTFPLYARLQAEVSEARKTFRKFFTGIMAAFIPVYGVLIVLAPAIVREALGSKWQGTEILISLLAVIGIIGLLGDAAVPLFNGLGYPNMYATMEIVQSVMLVGSAWFFTARFGLVGAGLAWFPAILASLFVSIYYLKCLLNRPFQGFGRTLAAISLATGLGMAAAYILIEGIPGLPGLIISAAAAGAAILLSLFLLDRSLKLEFWESIVFIFPQVNGLKKAWSAGGKERNG